MILKIYFCMTLIGITLGLTACGGGSSGSSSGGSTVSSLSFPIAQELANFISSSHAINYSMTGSQGINSLTGSGTISYSATTGATFEGQSALSNTTTVSGSTTANGSTTRYAFSGQNFYTTDYNQLGSIASGDYCDARKPETLPATAKVGDTGILGTMDCYQDSSKSVKTGTENDSYVIEADTSSTAIINLISDINTVSNTRKSSTQDRWRIDDIGNVTFVSLMITDYTTSPATVLTFTAK